MALQLQVHSYMQVEGPHAASEGINKFVVAKTRPSSRATPVLMHIDSLHDYLVFHSEKNVLLLLYYS